jgi:CheY-like chemotaxis protein
MHRRIHLDCNGRTAREVLDRLVREMEGGRNGRRVVLLVQNVHAVHDSLSRLLRTLMAYFNEREIKASIVEPSGCAATLYEALGGSVHVEICGSEADVMRPQHLLVVEDVQDSLDFLKTVLEAAGHRVTTARTGAEALEAVRREAFDLVLLDLVLPDMDGMAVARELSASKVPLVAVSAYLDRWTDRDFRRAGFRRQIRKPYKTSELLAALKAPREAL